MNVDDLLRKVDIVEVISRYVSLKRNGTNRKGLCPFHKEKSPSFMVSSDKQIYKCFGCGAGGNAVKFIMEYERVDFPDAIKLLAERYNVSLSNDFKPVQSKETHHLIMKTALQFFLSHRNEANDYIRHRGLSEESANTWNIGYAPSGNQLVNILQQKGFSSTDIEATGLIKSTQFENYSFFRERLMFPIFDHMGKVIAFGGRSMNNQEPKYLNSPESPSFNKSSVLYGLHLAKQSKKLIVVEGYMDVIAWHTLTGEFMAVGTCGTALTSNHIKLLKRYTHDISFCFDNDGAGKNATVKALKIAYENDIYPTIISLPARYKDIDEMIQDGEKSIPPPIDGFDWLLQNTLRDLLNPTTKHQFFSTIFEVIRSVQDYSTLLGFFEKISLYTNISSTTVHNEFRKYLQTNKSYSPPVEAQKTRDISTLLAGKYYQKFIVSADREELLIKCHIDIPELTDSHKEQQLLIDDQFDENKEKITKEIKTALLSMIKQKLPFALKTVAPEEAKTIIQMYHSLLHS